MLVKSICTNCGHSYLADDQAGELACPRCDVSNEGSRNPSDIPDAPPGDDPTFLEGFDDEFLGEEPFGEPRFDPQAPPPMFVNGERMVRGIVFGGLAAMVMGTVLAASLSAIGFILPAVAGAVIGLVAGASCRYGFGGRSARQTQSRAMVAVVAACVLGTGGLFIGSWTVERLTGSRAAQTREDLDEGLRGLLAMHARTADAGAATLIDRRIAEVERLRAKSDPQLEDYLWVQEAQINQPLLAYAKLRVTRGPVVRLGAEGEAFALPKLATAGVLLGEILLAIFLAARGVKLR